MIKLKVCGMKYEDNIETLISVEPDFMGFIFYKKSKRYIGDESFLLDKNQIIEDKSIKKVGVFVNETIEEIINIAQQFQLDIVQLHGDEHPDFCEQLKQHFKISKAFGVDKQFNFEKTKAYENHCDYFLFDTKTKQYGGSGKKFNWTILNNYTGNTPFFVAGGISLQDVNSLKLIKHPQFFGVDINSCFEIKPGLKNINLIKAFKQELQKLKI